MTYFSIAVSGFHGLAARRLEQGDVIWHSTGTQLVLGRAYLFSATRDPDAPEFWLQRPFDFNAIRQGKRHVSVDLATPLELGSLAICMRDWTPELKVVETTSSRVDNLRTALKRPWSYKVVIAGCRK